MKTSHILLAIVFFITLTGMVATDVLLKQQYEKIDWRNPYQNFERRPLPTAKHWVIEGTPEKEIVIVESTDKVQALIEPSLAKFYRIHQQGDTVFVTFTPDYSGYQSEPRSDADHEQRVGLVVRLSNLRTLRGQNVRLTLWGLATDKLTVSLQKSRLRTNNLRVSGSFDLAVSQNSFAVLGPTDRYKSLQMVVQDSSGVKLNNTQTDTFSKEMSPKAEVQLYGKALKWLK